MNDAVWLMSLLGDEERLMPYFIRHYSPHVDRMLMFDGGSSDRSRDILRTCANAVILPGPFDSGFDNRLWVEFLSVQIQAARGLARLVIIVDVDEFLYHPDGLTALLNSDECRNAGVIQAGGYQMVAETFPETDEQLTTVVRSGVIDHEYDKIVIVDPCVDITWSPGRHNYRCSAPVCRVGLKLLHYRYFGLEYLTRRNAKYYNNRSKAEAVAGYGYQCAPLYSSGKYSPAWYRRMAEIATDVVIT